MNDQLILDRYRLVERLAVGGSAEVWRAHDEQLDRPVAVKRLHPHLLPDAASRTRLVAEARAAARLSHPAIVGIYDVDATGESAALVMELVDGESLAARIERDGPLPPVEAVAITADVADALFAAHQQGVVHRDVKPGNVLLGSDGRTRLVDFGIVHSLAAAAERLTLTGTVIGTLRSMAPEQLVGGPITPRTDLYGLGVVLHEALTGRPPYPSGSPVALAEAQRAGSPQMDGVDPALAALIGACLAYQPTQRPLHAGALASALRAWQAGNPSAAMLLALAMPPDADAETRTVPAVGAAGAAMAGAATVAEAANGARAAPLPAHPSESSRFPDGSRRPPGAVRSSMGRPLIALAAAGALVLVAAFALGNNPGGPPAASQTAAPTVTPPTPAWMTELVGKISEACGADIAADAAGQMAAMSEEQAKELADDLKKQCEEGEGGGGRGNGGGGGGNGGGQGGGDD